MEVSYEDGSAIQSCKAEDDASREYGIRMPGLWVQFIQHRIAVYVPFLWVERFWRFWQNLPTVRKAWGTVYAGTRLLVLPRNLELVGGRTNNQ